MASNSGTTLWAAYLEVTHGDGADRARQQWIFLPPMHENMAPPGSPVVSHPSYFYRKQNRPDHKSTWKSFQLDNDLKMQGLHSDIDRAEARGWVAKPVITCQVLPQEMQEIAADWKTPWKVLNRLIRVADRLHGFKI